MQAGRERGDSAALALPVSAVSTCLSRQPSESAGNGESLLWTLGDGGAMSYNYEAVVFLVNQKIVFGLRV